MARPCCRSSSTVMICTGMCRVAGSCLRLFSTVQPSMSGRKMSSVMAVGADTAGPATGPIAAAGGHDHLEALVAGQAQEDARVMRVVLDDEQHGSPRLMTLAVVEDVLLAGYRRARASARPVELGRCPAELVAGRRSERRAPRSTAAGRG